MKICCPDCKLSFIKIIGKVPEINNFAGNKLDINLPFNKLYRCKNCNLYFKWPRLNREQLDELYQKGNPKSWHYELEDRKDWQIAIDWINNKNIRGSILDIGCWDGKFLNNFREKQKLYGIEINPTASHKASSKEVNIIAENISKMKDLTSRFDVITAFDFIEHVEYPLDFVASMASITKNDGYIIVSSGDTKALTWKISGSRYWYCSSPEHISFINLTWCYFVANKLNLQIEYIEYYSKASNNNPVWKIIDFIKNIIYLVAPTFFGKLRKIKRYYFNKDDNDNVYQHPPTWFTSKDHFIVVFRKKK